MGTDEVLKILDDVATDLLKKSETFNDTAKKLDYVVASNYVMHTYLSIKLNQQKVKERGKRRW